MLDSQLFGHRRGAFTGAVEHFPGIVRTADRGTLLLDEIGDMPLDVQPKLLRFLESGEVHPIGESRPAKWTFESWPRRTAASKRWSPKDTSARTSTTV